MLTVIVDANSICHRVRHKLGDLSFEESKVGIIFGFLRQILSVSKRLNSNKFLFCWDSRSRKRIEIYPQYKANRKKEKTGEEIELDEIAYAQFSALRTEILPFIGFRNNFLVEGFESDDIIARIVKDNNNDFVIVSTDSDLYQLLTNNVSMLISNDKPLITKDYFKKTYGISPSQWVDVKAIAGCSSDNVTGLKGVGVKTAIKYLRGELSSRGRSNRVIEAGNSIIELNRKVVRLPFDGIGSFKIKKDEFSFDNFLTICKKYGFNSFLSKETLGNWKRSFLI